MVAAIAAVLPFAGIVSVGGVALTTAAGGLTLAGVAVNVAGSLLLSVATNALLRPDIPEATRPENVQTTSKNAAGPRQGYFGIVKLGGNVVFHRADSGFSYRVIVHGHGEITRILQEYLNNEPVQVDPLGAVTDDQYQHGGRTRAQLHHRLGQVPETHYAEVTEIWDEWSSAHRLDGLSTTLSISESVGPEDFNRVFPNGEPDVAILAETTKCFDPRTGATAFTENAALAIAHYVASPDGLNRPNALEDVDLIPQADICDRDAALVAGGTEKLFRISGTYLLNERPQDVLQRMLDACAGRMRLKPAGKVALKVGVWEEPKFTLDFSHLVEVSEVSTGPDLLDRYNELPARFIDHDLEYIEVDAEPWRDEARTSEDGEVLVGQAKNLLMVPSHRQARAIMKIMTERDNPRQTISLICKPAALAAIYEDTLALNIPQFGFVGDYEIQSHDLSFEKGLLKSVRLDLRKIDASAFSLALDEQGTVQTLPEPQTSAGVPLPENVTAAAAGVQVAVNAFAAGIGVGWEAPPSDALTPVLKYTQADEENWLDVTVGTGATSVTISGLTDGQAYDVSLAFMTPGGVLGEAVIIEDVTASAAADAPVPPTGLVVTDIGGGQALVEMTASASESLWKTEIYRDGALVGVTFADPGTGISFVDNSGSGVFAWTARSINVSGRMSDSDAGPVTETIV
ncbi:MAG: fibronectin type III domain-containing protein [Pseudomonadota bacterium]